MLPVSPAGKAQHEQQRSRLLTMEFRSVARPDRPGAAAASHSRWGGDPRDRDPADGDALHPRGRELEQVRDLGRRHETAERGDERSKRAREPAAVEALADDHPAAVKAVLPAS